MPGEGSILRKVQRFWVIKHNCQFELAIVREISGDCIVLKDVDVRIRSMQQNAPFGLKLNTKIESPINIGKRRDLVVGLGAP